MRLRIAWLLALGACTPSATPAPSPEPTSAADVVDATPARQAASPNRSCLGLSDEVMCSLPEDDMEAVAVTGEPLETCSLDPRTGFFRDGLCRTGPNDRGVHVVCAEVTDAFLEYSKSRGNDLITPVPDYGFPGLREGDRWCLCAARWEEARKQGVAPPVVTAATHHAALRTLDAQELTRHAAR